MALTVESLKPIFPKYDYKYTERPKAACATYLSDRNPFNIPLANNVGEYQMEEMTQPLRAASNCGQQLTTTTFKDTHQDWKGKSRGLFFHHHPHGDLNVNCVKLSEDCKSPVPVICRERTKTRCTQTRYRESSAQTRPYLPEIANNKENYENFEVYQISKLIDSYQPPGEYEAKVVERARRRRKYEQTLKLLNTRNKEKHQFVVEAMEWEDWVAREEYIQGCQMLRMEIVEKMFRNREENLRKMSIQRISHSTARIEAKRQAQLQKINIEYDRGMRILEAKKQKVNRCYRKGNIIQEHIDPASDLHAPQMRFGVNPNRRHFVGFRKHFDDRIDELDKQRDDGSLSSLACPFRKLKTWSKPKERMKEVTQRFCSDENLKNVYESLRGIRINPVGDSERDPKCLKRKAKTDKPIDTLKVVQMQISMANLYKPDDEPIDPEIKVKQELSEETQEVTTQPKIDEIPFKSEDEIANILGEFEGTTLGKLLQFLGDELERLKLQKKFQAIHLLAKKERWWREAAEAGLRQKENKQREEQNELFAKAYETRQDTSSLFLESVLEREFNFTQESLARQNIAELAKQFPEFDQEELDHKIMLSQGKDKNTYDLMVVSDFVRNNVLAVAEERFAKMKVDRLQGAYVRVIEEELYASVEKALAIEFQTPEAVCIVGEVLDELIDNAVTYEFDIISPSSSESEFNTQLEVNYIINKLLVLAIKTPSEKSDFLDSTDVDTKLTAEKEAKALIRKLIRKTIPQERWKPESERIVEQTLSDTFNEAINEIECLKASRQVQADDRLHEVISEIYHRMAECWGRKFESNKAPSNSTEESSQSEISGVLRSVTSNIDIFDTGSLSSPDGAIADNESESLIKLHYLHPKKVHNYARVELNRLEEDSQTSGKSNTLSTKPIYPDLPDSSGNLTDNGDDRVRLMSVSYERESACFENACAFQGKPQDSCARPGENRKSSP
ncbi:cilia- and flagella-associated protein 91-like [Eupeodes corollae]|uniref:cilia- and flagella-associated protein 91-like n=1 Tax=Eupeodes corollae TaxID=290404 RepID=UPI002490F17B|nr:cilia- and flagella-associated protein 91-like [Eupeodes corollae]XP_055917466.1 cilia- and flagella-associated protein 91-like [Eupeodes corollae]